MNVENGLHMAYLMGYEDGQSGNKVTKNKADNLIDKKYIRKSDNTDILEMFERAIKETAEINGSENSECMCYMCINVDDDGACGKYSDSQCLWKNLKHFKFDEARFAQDGG